MTWDKHKNAAVLNRLMWFQPILNAGFTDNQSVLNIQLYENL
jgi:hypothetical protein